MFEVMCSLELFGKHPHSNEKSKEAVEMAVKELVKRIGLREELRVLKEEYQPAEPMEKQPDFFIAAVELLVSVETFEALVGFMIDFGPSHLEILKPHGKVTLDVNEIESGLNEALFKIQELDKTLKITANTLLKLQRQGSQQQNQKESTQ
ncbi:hypothetical protein COT72_03560 [archaeon CG10_big_fil_rev_8_21_14_0_10_43_11]|nr:MAG: hypothetical protein COT72_03560 [archaeon CG10_big_fil_rev_8_21_14_0_10_43_11]